MPTVFYREYSILAVVINVISVIIYSRVAAVQNRKYK